MMLEHREAAVLWSPPAGVWRRQSGGTIARCPRHGPVLRWSPHYTLQCNGHHTLAAGQMRIQPAACRSYFCNTVSNTHDNKNYEDNDNPVLQPKSKSHDFHCFIPSCPLNFCQTQGQHLLLRYKNLRWVLLWSIKDFAVCDCLVSGKSMTAAL